jgi:hypothetical protein
MLKCEESIVSDVLKFEMWRYPIFRPNGNLGKMFIIRLTPGAKYKLARNTLTS